MQISRSLTKDHTTMAALRVGRSALLAMTLVATAWPGCTAMVTKTHASSIPTNLQVPVGFESKELWQESPVTPLDLNLGSVTTKDEISVSSMISQHTAEAGAIACKI